MNTARRFVLNSPLARRAAVSAIMAAPDGVECVIRARMRSVDQNALLHAVLADIARQVEFFGCKYDMETVKRLLVDAFARVKAGQGEPLHGWGQMLPSLDGTGFVQLGIQTRRLTTAQMSEFIEYLYAYGAENGVQWSGPVEVPDWYRDREVV